MTERLDLDFLSPLEDEERRETPRHDSPPPESVVVRVVGGSEARLLDLSRRGLLIETESRLAIGQRATVRITTRDGVVMVAGVVVRSLVAKMGASVVFNTALALDDDLMLVETLPRRPSTRDRFEPAVDPQPEEPLLLFESAAPFDTEAWQPESLEFSVAFAQGLDELRHRAAEHGDEI
jgi:hypothetical protein